MTTRSTTHGKPHLLRPTQQQESNGGTPHSPPEEQPAANPKPDTSRGEPEAPTDKPLPDLPNPEEVGEDG